MHSSAPGSLEEELSGEQAPCSCHTSPGKMENDSEGEGNYSLHTPPSLPDLLDNSSTNCLDPFYVPVSVGAQPSPCSNVVDFSKAEQVNEEKEKRFPEGARFLHTGHHEDNSCAMNAGDREGLHKDENYYDIKGGLENINASTHLNHSSSFPPALNAISLLPSKTVPPRVSFSPRIPTLKARASGISSTTSTNLANTEPEELDRFQYPSHHTSMSMRAPPLRYHEFRKGTWSQGVVAAAKGVSKTHRTGSTARTPSENSSRRGKRLLAPRKDESDNVNSNQWPRADGIPPMENSYPSERKSVGFLGTLRKTKRTRGLAAVKEDREKGMATRSDQVRKEGEALIVVPQSTLSSGAMTKTSPATSLAPPVFITATSLLHRDGVDGGSLTALDANQVATHSKMSLWPLSIRDRPHLPPVTKPEESKSWDGLLAVPSRAPLALQIEAFIRKEHRQFLLDHPGCAKAETLEIFREAFRVLTEHFSEYRAVLNLIQDEYDAALAEVQNEVKRMRIIDLENKSDRSLHAMELAAVKESLNATISNQRAELLAAHGLIRGLREQLSASETANKIIRRELRENHSDRVHGQEQVKLLSNALVEEANRSAAMATTLKSKSKDMELLNSCVKVLREEVEELHLALMEQLHIAMDQRQQLAGLRGGRLIGSSITSTASRPVTSVRGATILPASSTSSGSFAARKTGMLPSWGTSKAADALSKAKDLGQGNTKDGALSTGAEGKGKRGDGDGCRTPHLTGQQGRKKEEETDGSGLQSGTAATEEVVAGNTYPELYVVSLLSRVDALSWEMEQWKQKASQLEGLMEYSNYSVRGTGQRYSQGAFSALGSGGGVDERDGKQGGAGPLLSGPGSGVEGDEGNGRYHSPPFESPFFMETGLTPALPSTSSFQSHGQSTMGTSQSAGGAGHGEDCSNSHFGNQFPRFNMSCSTMNSSQGGNQRLVDAEGGTSKGRKRGIKGGGDRPPSFTSSQGTTHYLLSFSSDKNAVAQDPSFAIESGSHTANALAIHSSLILPHEVEEGRLRRVSEREGTLELSGRRSSGSSTNSGCTGGRMITPVPQGGAAYTFPPLDESFVRAPGSTSPPPPTPTPAPATATLASGSAVMGKTLGSSAHGAAQSTRNGTILTSAERGLGVTGGAGRGIRRGSGEVGHRVACASTTDTAFSRDGATQKSTNNNSVQAFMESGSTAPRFTCYPSGRTILGGGTSGLLGSSSRLGLGAAAGASTTAPGAVGGGRLPSCEALTTRQASSHWSGPGYDQDDRDQDSEAGDRPRGAVTVSKDMFPVIKTWLNVEGILDEDLAPTDILLPTGLWPGMDMSIFGLATPVKNLHLSLSGFHKIVKRIWAERETKVYYTRLPTFFMSWLEKEAGGEYNGKVLGINIVHVCQRNMHDPDCYVFLQALRGFLSEEIAMTWRRAIRYLRHACENNTKYTETGGKMIPIALLFEAIRGFFPEKPVHNMLQLRFCVYRASRGAEDALWPKLLKEGSSFIQTLKRQIIQEIEIFTLMVVERVRTVAEPSKVDQVQVKNVMKALQSCDSSMPDYVARKLTAEACLKTVHDVALADDTVVVGLQMVLRRFRSVVLLRRTGVPNEEEEATRLKAEQESILK